MPKIEESASAAVAIIRCTAPSETLLLVRRTAHPDDPWSGHFSFPGGRRDPGDKDLLATSIRETREETGIELSASQLTMRLERQPAGRGGSLLVWVQPFVFELPAQPTVLPNPKEVDYCHWLNPSHFLDPKRHVMAETVPGMSFPAFPLDNYYIWGFTYRLLFAVLSDRGTSFSVASR